MQTTFDYMFAKISVSQRRAFVWTEILRGIEFAVDIVKSETRVPLEALLSLNSLEVNLRLGTRQQLSKVSRTGRNPAY